MAALPVAISLTASFMSSITIIGTPSEFYRYGIMFLWFLVTYTLAGVLVSFTLLEKVQISRSTFFQALTSFDLKLT